MATITSLGTGSGLDLEGIVAKLMSVEKLPLTALTQKEASFQAKLTAYGSIKGALSTLQTAAQTLKATTTFTGTNATVTDTTLLSAATTSSAATGNHTISIGQLAQAQILRSNTNFAATTDTFNTGTIAIGVGGAAAVNVSITASNNTLAGIRDAINAAGAGVTASVVNDGTTNRLLIASKTTGLTAGTVSVTVTDSGSGGTYALSTLDGASLVQVQAPLDASLSVDGLAVTRSANVIADVLDGVTLTLTKAGTLASPLTTQLSITRSTAATQTAITAFVTSYNTAMTQMRSLSAYNTSTSTASLLTGDSTLRGIQSTLSSLIGTRVSGLSGNISRLSDIGIAAQTDGTLSINTSKLQTALNDSSANVSGFFTSTTTGNEGLAVRLDTALDGILGTSGTLAGRTDGINRSIQDITDRREALSLRLTKIEAQYRAQFVALDKTLASMQGTSSYLTQQLDYLKAVSTSIAKSSSS